jgi:uncharacterized protein (TIGR02246 family)
MDAGEAAGRWAATWTAAWKAHDVEAVVALYAEDCVHRSTPFRPPHRGRQGVRDYVAGAFAAEQGVEEVRFGTPVVQATGRAWSTGRGSATSTARRPRSPGAASRASTTTAW